MRVLVTGATGFLGSLVIDVLLEAGHEARALVRASSNCAALEQRGVFVLRASLESGEGIGEALDGVDAVVHCAGGGKAKNQTDFRRNNTTTTKVLLAAVLEHAPALRRFVLVSSLAARGPGKAGQETAPVSEYGRSKAAAEDLVLAAAGSLPVTILRAPALYGPGDRRMLPLFRAAGAGIGLAPRSSQATSLLHGRDCAYALLAIVQGRHDSGRIYTVSDGSEYSAEQLTRAIAAVRRRRIRVLSLPGWMLRSVAALAEVWAFLSGREVLLTRDKVSDLIQPLWLCDSTAIGEELGWKPSITTQEGLQETARWYLGQGLISD